MLRLQRRRRCAVRRILWGKVDDREGMLDATVSAKLGLEAEKEEAIFERERQRSHRSREETCD